jgi:hypothetical protein
MAVTSKARGPEKEQKEEGRPNNNRYSPPPPHHHHHHRSPTTTLSPPHLSPSPSPHLSPLVLPHHAHLAHTTAQVLAAASKALSLSNPSTGSTISAPDAAASAFGSVTSFAQRSVEAAGNTAQMPESFKNAAMQSGAWAATEQSKADLAAATQMAANAAAAKAGGAAP